MNTRYVITTIKQGWLVRDTKTDKFVSSIQTSLKKAEDIAFDFNAQEQEKRERTAEHFIDVRQADGKKSA